MLLLVPSPLSQKTPQLSVLTADLPLIQQCNIWIVENAKPARAALSLFKMNTPIRELEIHEMEKLTPDAQQQIIEQAKAGVTIGLMSDAGCPGIADPGAIWVKKAHQAGCIVRPLVGPSSIVLALMSSGLNGQQFTFHGYPPIDAHTRETWIKQTEKQSKLSCQTQIAIETPFRNEKLLESLLKTLQADTQLCLAWDLTGQEEHVQTKTIQQWAKELPKIGKFPCLFMWLS